MKYKNSLQFKRIKFSLAVFVNVWIKGKEHGKMCRLTWGYRQALSQRNIEKLSEKLSFLIY